MKSKKIIENWSQETSHQRNRDYEKKIGHEKKLSVKFWWINQQKGRASHWNPRNEAEFGHRVKGHTSREIVWDSKWPESDKSNEQRPNLHFTISNLEIGKGQDTQEMSQRPICFIFMLSWSHSIITCSENFKSLGNDYALTLAILLHVGCWF